VLVAVFSVPVMLLAKPLIERRHHLAKVYSVPFALTNACAQQNLRFCRVFIIELVRSFTLLYCS